MEERAMRREEEEAEEEGLRQPESQRNDSQIDEEEGPPAFVLREGE